MTKIENRVKEDRPNNYYTPFVIVGTILSLIIGFGIGYALKNCDPCACLDEPAFIAEVPTEDFTLPTRLPTIAPTKTTVSLCSSFEILSPKPGEVLHPFHGKIELSWEVCNGAEEYLINAWDEHMTMASIRIWPYCIPGETDNCYQEGDVIYCTLDWVPDTWHPDTTYWIGDMTISLQANNERDGTDSEVIVELAPLE